LEFQIFIGVYRRLINLILLRALRPKKECMLSRNVRTIVRTVAVAILGLMLGSWQPTYAQMSYPTKPMRLVIGYPPGGTSDIVAREFAKRLYESWGQSVVVDNRPGASGVLAANLVSQASPDGHTILIMPSTFYNNILLSPGMPVDPFKDFDPVAKIATVANVAVVPTAFPGHSIKDFISAAKAKPGAFSFASGGVGTTHHLAMELLQRTVGIKMVHVPYKGTPPALLDVVAGRVQIMLAGVPAALPMIRNGQLKAIGVSTLKRIPDLPDVPAIAETVPNFEATLGYVVLAPAKTPRAVIKKLNVELLRLLDQQSVKETLSRTGFIPDGKTPEETERYLKAEFEKWAGVIRAAHITVN
jgi:tripartite-type tricarboxylate transporter receptor subunit TctC